MFLFYFLFYFCTWLPRYGNPLIVCCRWFILTIAILVIIIIIIIVVVVDLSAGETLLRIVVGTHPWLVCRIMGAIVEPFGSKVNQVDFL